MVYRDMSDNEFYEYINNVIDNKDFDTINSLSHNEHFMEYLSGAIENENYDFGFRRRLNYFKSYLLKFNYILEIKNLCSNYNKYSLEERRNIIKKGNVYSRKFNLELFDEDFKIEFHSLVSYFFGNRCTDISSEEYSKVKEVCKNILEAYYKNNDMNDAGYVIFVNKYSQLENNLVNKYSSLKNYIDLLEKYYFNSIFNDDSEKVFNEFSYKDIILLTKIDEYFSYDFFRNIYSPTNTIINNNKIDNNFEPIIDFCKLLNQLEKKYNYDYYEISYALAHDYNINITKLNTELLNSYHSYWLKVFDKRSQTDENIEVFKNIYSFYKTIVAYSNLVTKFLTLSNIIVSNDPKRERMIELSYDLLFFNNIAPSMNVHRFNNKEALYPTLDGRNKLKEYYKGYEEYFINEKNKIEKEKEEEQLKKDLLNLPKYEKIISDYIENGSTISIYCNSINITENEFRHILKILEENNSPVYHEYEEYLINKQSKTYAALINRLKKMLKNLMENKDKYNLLDYYNETKLSFSEVIKILEKDITPDERRAFMKFTSKYKNDTLLNSKGIKDFINNYNVSYGIKNEQGVFSDRYEVTKADKQQVIFLLNKNNIPITTSTCNLMLKKHFDENILPTFVNKQK